MGKETEIQQSQVVSEYGKQSADPRIDQSVNMALMLARIILFRERYERETGRPFPKRGYGHDR